MTDDALYTMRMPETTMTSKVTNGIQSVFSCCAISIPRGELLDDPLERFSAMFEAGELVEAGARRSQQNRVARSGMTVGVTDSGIQRAGVDQRHGPANLIGDLPGRRADQQPGACLRDQRLAERAVVEALVLAAQDHPQAAGERSQRL